MFDLLKLAEESTEKRDLWERQQKACTVKHVVFENIVSKTTSITINGEVSNCIEIFFDGKIKNMYKVVQDEVAIADTWSNTVDRSLDDYLKRKFGKFYDLRIRFDKAFNDYTGFIYTVLNINNKGLRKYGDISLNFNRKDNSFKVVFLLKESLKYFDENGELLLDELKRGLSLNHSVHKLAKQKHYIDIEKYDLLGNGTNFENLNFACNEDDYIEGIVLDDLTLDALESVTIAQQIFDVYNKLYESYFVNEHLDELQRLKLKQYIYLKKLLRNRNLRLTPVE